MSVFDRVKYLADRQHISVRKVAVDLGLGESYMYTLKRKVPNGTNLEKLADYFKVSVDYLLEREEIDQTNAPIDIVKELSVDDIDWNSFLSAGGKPISDRAKANILAAFYDEINEYKNKTKN